MKPAPQPPLTIVLATGNPHKVDELRAIFASLAAPAGSGGAAGAPTLTILGLADLPGHERFREPDETGTTFAANARIKAVSYAKQTGMLCLADDSGIEIDALALADGTLPTPRPGVISSHYFNDNQPTTLTRPERDAANNARVLHELEGVPIEQRTARFVCCMCLAGASGEVLHETRGTFEGRIGTPPRVPAGDNGFGYDPLFLVAPEYARTGAELSSDEKNTLSHRAMAARVMTAWIAGAALV
jgi:non-canonical purine NTP pyrophosphatase (RdgB/HAM1 family)